MEGREREAPGEARQLGNDHRLEACLAIDMVVAWRLLPLTKLGREIPDAPKPVFFEEAEWKALYMDNFHSKKPEPPEIPPTLRAATRMVAKRGGFLGGKGDGEPGTEVLWKGLQSIENVARILGNSGKDEESRSHIFGAQASCAQRDGWL